MLHIAVQHTPLPGVNQLRRDSHHVQYSTVQYLSL
jgi:hypothetical protein